MHHPVKRHQANVIQVWPTSTGGILQSCLQMGFSWDMLQERVIQEMVGACFLSWQVEVGPNLSSAVIRSDHALMTALLQSTSLLQCD